MTHLFTQVFRDGFFHAQHHPGNIQVKPGSHHLRRDIALDFGIIGTLTEVDKDYLAQNFIAFFHRDYKRVAELHIESAGASHHPQRHHTEAAIGVTTPTGLLKTFAGPGVDVRCSNFAPLQR